MATRNIKEPVGVNRLTATYKVYFINVAGKPICQPCVIIAAKTSPIETGRVLKAHFTLNNQPYDKKEKYYLVIESGDGSIYKRVEFTIDISFDF